MHLYILLFCPKLLFKTYDMVLKIKCSRITSIGPDCLVVLCSAYLYTNCVLILLINLWDLQILMCSKLWTISCFIPLYLLFIFYEGGREGNNDNNILILTRSNIMTELTCDWPATTLCVWENVGNVNCPNVSAGTGWCPSGDNCNNSYWWSFPCYSGVS